MIVKKGLIFLSNIRHKQLSMQLSNTYLCMENPGSLKERLISEELRQSLNEVAELLLTFMGLLQALI